MKCQRGADASYCSKEVLQTVHDHNLGCASLIATKRSSQTEDKFPQLQVQTRIEGQNTVVLPVTINKHRQDQQLYRLGEIRIYTNNVAEIRTGS